MRTERGNAGLAGRSYPSPRAGGSAPRGRAADRDRLSGPVPRPAAGGRSADDRPAARTYTGTPGPGPGTRGAVAVAGMFGLTLAAAAVDSYIGVGLGLITLIALLVSSAVAAFVVRRRDLLSVLVAPPLVFVAVALVDIVLAPSATFSLPTLATLLIRGFPAMGLAVGAALVIGLGRLAARR